MSFVSPRALATGLLAGALLSTCPSQGNAAVVSGDWIAVDTGSKVCDVTSYGAVGDGVTDDTKAVQAAIDACAGGGAVMFPSPAVYLTFGVSTDKATNLGMNVQPGAVWRFNNDTSAPQWQDKKPGQCIIVSATGFVIFGGGVVDGNGAAWWPDENGYRPGLLKVDGTELLITNVTFINSPNHNLQLYAGNTEVVDTVVLAAPPCGEDPGPGVCAHNTDAVDVHAGPMWIHRCHFAVGDDNVAMHANDTLVNDNYFGTGHGASIGSLGVGTFIKNITVRDCTFNNTVQAIRIKSDPGATGFLTDVLYTNITTHGCGETLLVSMFYPAPDPTKHTTLAISNVTFSDVTAYDSGSAGALQCDSAAPCTGFVMERVQHVSGTPKPWSACTAVSGTATDVTPALPPGCL